MLFCDPTAKIFVTRDENNCRGNRLCAGAVDQGRVDQRQCGQLVRETEERTRLAVNDNPSAIPEI